MCTIKRCDRCGAESLLPPLNGPSVEPFPTGQTRTHDLCFKCRNELRGIIDNFLYKRPKK